MTTTDAAGAVFSLSTPTGGFVFRGLRAAELAGGRRQLQISEPTPTVLCQPDLWMASGAANDNAVVESSCNSASTLIILRRCLRVGTCGLPGPVPNIQHPQLSLRLYRSSGTQWLLIDRLIVVNKTAHGHLAQEAAGHSVHSHCLMLRGFPPPSLSSCESTTYRAMGSKSTLAGFWSLHINAAESPLWSFWGSGMVGGSTAAG